jgi:hypothetical protein
MSILIPILQTILILGGIYWVSLIKENAKNKSQKQYLEGLTRISEEVKQQFTKDHAILESTLMVLSNKENVLFGESKDAIIEYFSNINKWIWYFQRISPNDFNIRNYLNIPSRLGDLTNLYHETNLSFGKLQILLIDDILIRAAHETIMKALELNNYVESMLIEVHRALASELVNTILSKKGFFPVRRLSKRLPLKTVTRKSKDIDSI